MKKNVILTVVALMAFAVGASAQGFGVNAGVNFFNQKIKGGDIELDTKILTGFHIGVDYEIAVAPDFYFAPGLQFSTKGYKFESLGTEEVKAQLNYLEVPLNLVYKPLLGSGNLIVNFGPYLGYGIGGKIKSEVAGTEVNTDVKWGSDKDDLKPFDMGANIGFGYMLGGGLSVKFNAQLGLINISPEGDSDNLIKNNGFGLSVGYRF
ncbi:MAG: porin family protein [Bacteroidales bacterium]|nr:porin family protein [Bacteroidales bacterium]